MHKPTLRSVALLLALFAAWPGSGQGQTPPSAAERAAYTGLFRAVADGDAAAVSRALAAGAVPDARDGSGRTPLHVAAHAGQHEMMRTLVAAGGDPNALDHQRYDIVTIAAVANDLPTLDVALALGGRAGNVTSPYDGTALIAAAHLGHADVVARLIAASAPLDHINNLGWTALIEAIVLGDGGAAHQRTLGLLLDAGADPNLADGYGRSPLVLARARGYTAMAERLLAAGGR